MTSENRTPGNSEAIVVSSNGTAPEFHRPDFIVEPYAESSELLRRWQVLRRYLVHMAVAVILGVGLALYFRGPQVTSYSATTTVRFSDTRASLTSGVLGTQDAYSRWDPVKTQAELLNTRATRERAVDSAALQVMATPPALITWLTSIDAASVSTGDT